MIISFDGEGYGHWVDKTILKEKKNRSGFFFALIRSAAENHRRKVDVSVRQQHPKCYEKGSQAVDGYDCAFLWDETLGNCVVVGWEQRLEIKKVMSPWR